MKILKSLKKAESIMWNKNVHVRESWPDLKYLTHCQSLGILVK